MLLNKEEVFQTVVAQLEESLRILKETAIEAKEASTNEESKAENKYDTRGLEAGYLAQGQAVRAQKLEETLFNLKKVTLKPFDDKTPIGVSALVRLRSEDDSEKWIFLIPANGVTVESKGLKVQSTSLESPMGSSLLDNKVGDSIFIHSNEFEICDCL